MAATKSAIKTDIMTAPSAAVAAVASVPTLLPPKPEEAEPKRAAKRARKEPPVPGGEVSSAAPKAKKTPAAETEAEAAVDGEKVSESANWLVVAKTVRGLLKASPTPMHCGSDALPALNAKVSELINEAIGRALANGRKTLKNCDF